MNGKVTPQQVFIFVAVSFAGWLLYKLFDKVSAGAGQIPTAFEKVYEYVTADGDVSVNAGVRLPNGKVVQFDDIIEGGSTINAKNEFTYAGKRYRLTGARDGGVYAAVGV